MVGVLRVFDIELLENIIQAQLKGVVDNDAHGPLIAMLTNVSDAIGEDTFTEAGHGDQEMILECVGMLCVHDPIVHDPIIGLRRPGYKSVWSKVTISVDEQRYRYIWPLY